MGIFEKLFFGEKVTEEEKKRDKFKKEYEEAKNYIKELSKKIEKEKEEE